MPPDPLLAALDAYIQRPDVTLPIDKTCFALRAQAYGDVLHRVNDAFVAVTDARFRAAFSDISMIAQLAVVLDKYLMMVLHGLRPMDAFQDEGAYRVFLNTNVVGQGPVLRQNYPLLDLAFNQAEANYTNNIASLRTRLTADWTNLEQVFRRGLIDLRKIQSAGSDFHKRGSQVLILTFSTATGPFKLVYKPSDVELDYWVTGATAALTPIPGWPAGQSLIELLNAAEPDPRLQLPAYTIYPAVRGSQQADMHAALENAYGYLEFIEYNEFVGEAERPAFFYQVGKLAGIAAALSMRDVHQENLIVSGAKPHLIDLEASLLEKNESVGGTGLLQNVEKGKAGSPYLAVRFGANQPFIVVDGAHDTGNVIRDNGEPIRAAPYASQILQGYCAILAALANNAQVAAWLEHLGNVVARHVPIATEEFHAAFITFMSPAQGVSVAAQTQRFTDAFTQGYADKATEWIEAVNGDPDPPPDPPDPWALPRFLCQGPNMLADFATLDIPAFYARPSGPDLYDSRGNVVSPGPTPAPPRTTYFPVRPIDRIRAQLTTEIAQRQATAANDIARIMCPPPQGALTQAAPLVRLPTPHP